MKKKLTEEYLEKDFKKKVKKIRKLDKKVSESKETKRFSVWDINNHVTLYQDFNQIGLDIGFSHSEDDEFNMLFHMKILFWSIEISWNGRRK